MCYRLIISALCCLLFGANSAVCQQQQPQYPCLNCGPHELITQMDSICINGTKYQVTVTHCTVWNLGLATEDPCRSILRPNVLTTFREICVTNGLGLNLADVQEAVLCLYDPCNGNKIGATVPDCSADPDDAYCWAYSFPRCMQVNINNCWTACQEQEPCCWRHRRYCVDKTDPLNPVCRLRPYTPIEFIGDWNCVDALGACPQGCQQSTCPAPRCTSCTP